MRETAPSDKVQVRELGELMLPATCAMCGNGTCVKGYVDPMILIDWYGSIYFCKPCAIQIAETIGCLTPDESEFLTQQNKELAEANARLQEKNHELNRRVSVFVDAINGSADLSTVLDPVSEPEPESVSDELPAKPVEQPAELINELIKSGEGDESESPKPTTKRRPNDASQPTAGNSSSTFTL